MVTPELLEYVRTEIAKGKTREEIHTTLISGGGWSEADLSEAFRVVIPMQDIVLLDPIVGERQKEKKPSKFILPATSFSSLEPTPLSKPASAPRSFSSFLKFLIILIIIGGLGFGFWFYRSQIMSLWDSLVNKASNFYTLSVNTNNTTNSTPNTDSNNQAIVPNPISPIVAQAKDCGTMNTALKFGVPSTYENNSVLSCLGKSAINCENAKGILKDDFFPTIFEITKLSDSCDFKLSYPLNSTLTDITGKKLAGQYISCPLNIVKAIDNTNPAAPQFIASDKTDLSKFASQIYFYGTLGLFAENNLDQNKIKNLGCQGEYIQSMIASYNSAQKK